MFVQSLDVSTTQLSAKMPLQTYGNWLISFSDIKNHRSWNLEVQDERELHCTTSLWFCEEFACSPSWNLLCKSAHLKHIEVPTHCGSELQSQERRFQPVCHDLGNLFSTVWLAAPGIDKKKQDGTQNPGLEWEHQKKHQHFSKGSYTNTQAVDAWALNQKVFCGGGNAAQTSLRPEIQIQFLASSTHQAISMRIPK